MPRYPLPMSSASLRFLLRPICFASVAATLAAVGCSSATPPNPRVYLQSQIDDGTNPPPGCGIVASSNGWVDIGSVNQSIDNGGSQTGGPVTVSCSVTSNGDGSFQVNAAATVGGAAGGSVTIVGKFTSSGMQSGITAHFQRGDGSGSFQETDCTASYATNANMGVAAGRIWAQLECPTVIDNEKTTPLVCEGKAEFRFEDCSGS